MKNYISHLARHRSRKRKGDTAQLAAQLAPLEELNKTAQKQGGDAITGFHDPVAHQEVGAIVVEADSVNHAENQRTKHEAMLGLEPVVIVILCLMLGFIAFVAWQISQMPPQ